MDVAVYVGNVKEDVDTGDLSISGIWVNQGQTKTFIIGTKAYPLGIPAQFTIKSHQIRNWLVSKEPNDDFIRNKEWIQL